MHTGEFPDPAASMKLAQPSRWQGLCLTHLFVEEASAHVPHQEMERVQHRIPSGYDLTSLAAPSGRGPLNWRRAAEQRPTSKLSPERRKASGRAVQGSRGS